MKMDSPLKTKSESHVALIEVDLQNKIIDFIQQSILLSFVGTKQDINQYLLWKFVFLDNIHLKRESGSLRTAYIGWGKAVSFWRKQK